MLWCPGSEEVLEGWERQLVFWQKEEAKASGFKVFECQEEIRKCELKIQECKAARKKYETNRKANRENIIYKSLLSLNYTKQRSQFDDFWNQEFTRQIGSFVIHGQQDCCQDWLIHPLVRQSRLNSTLAEKIHIYLSDDDECDIASIWEVLARSLKCDSTEPIDLVNRTYEYWKKETVILIFYNLEQLDRTQISILIEKFWLPLLNLVEPCSSKCLNAYGSNYLAMFLVDNRGCMKTWEINFECTKYTLVFEPLNNFKKSELKGWYFQEYENVSNFLPNKSEVNKWVESLWQQSEEGVPVKVMKAICDKCGTNWEEVKGKI